MMLFNMLVILLGGLVSPSGAAAAGCPAYLDVEVRKLRGQETVNLCSLTEGKPTLIVNTASYCGYTPQFRGLEALHREYGDRGLVVLGFPSPDFRQEDRDEEKTARVCYANFGVTFSMFAPVHVTGVRAHPVFQELTRQSRAPNWNFNKYLLDRNGTVVKSFPGHVEPGSREMTSAIEQLF